YQVVRIGEWRVTVHVTNGQGNPQERSRGASWRHRRNPRMSDSDFGAWRNMCHREHVDAANQFLMKNRGPAIVNCFLVGISGAVPLLGGSGKDPVSALRRQPMKRGMNRHWERDRRFNRNVLVVPENLLAGDERESAPDDNSHPL